MTLIKGRAVLILFVCIGLSAGLLASEDSDRASQNPSGSGTKLQDQESRTSESYNFTFGWDQRFRNEDWNNIQDQNSDTDDVRMRSIFRQRLWLSVFPGTPDINFCIRMLNQFAKTSTPSIPLNWDEVAIDNLFVHFKKTFIPGVSIKAGRQDMSFGEGFILMDGSADDGPRTAYMNAIDIIYKYKKSKLDVLGIHNPRQDRFLPIINDQHRYLNPSDEQALGLYYADRNRQNTDFDAYYFLKKEINNWHPPDTVQFQPDRHVNTMGGRIVHRLDRGFTATGEFALQRGWQHPDTPISAWGGYGYLKKQFSGKWNPYVIGGYWALSGDDPVTSNRYEGWDPLFERWPKWSGMYAWSLVPEKGISYWTNMRMIQAEAGFTPWKPVLLKSVWYHTDAFHPYVLGNQNIFAGGTHRGEIMELIAMYQFGSSIAGEFRYEILNPGNFYRGQATGQFFRFEINYSWKHSFSP
jgi:hypothetical protein